MILENRNEPHKAVRRTSLVVASLNMYHRMVGNEIYSYISNHPEVDVWCLQEVNSSTIDVVSSDNRHSSMLEKLRELKPDFMTFHAPLLLFMPVDSPEFRSDYGTTIMCRYGLPVVDYRQLQLNGHIHSSMWTPENQTDHSRAIQYLTLDWADGSKPITVYNYHGIWQKSLDKTSRKGDTAERIKISRKIRKLIDDQNSDTIICGDFNLDHDTESISIMRGNMVDLIAEYCIKTTRSILYKKTAPYADYIFISKELKVNNFIVENIVISDHLPLVAHIQI